MHKRRIRKRNSKQPFARQYEELESRQLLAANLLSNGSFEVGGANFDGIQNDTEVAGWNAWADANGERLLDVVSGQSGNYLKLDALPGRHDNIYQNVETVPGQKYILKFDVFGEGDGSDRSDEVLVFWDGELVAAFRGIGEWQTVAVELIGEVDGPTRLELRETGSANGGDGVGALIDNVSLISVVDYDFSNGGFELGNRSDSTAHTLIEDIPTWFTDGKSNERAASIRKYNNPSDGNRYYWNMDSSYRYDRLFHAMPTAADRDYVLMFDTRSPSSSLEATNQVRIRWNGKWIGTRIPSTTWQTFIVELPGEKDGLSWLDLREPYDKSSPTGDGVGPWIDNLRVYEIENTPDVKFDLNGLEPGVFSRQTFTGETLSTAVAPEASVTSDGINIDSVSLRIANAFDGFDEVLSVGARGGNLVSTYNDVTNRLVISGAGTAADYQDVLRSVQYTNLSLNPTEHLRDIDLKFQSGDSLFSSKAIIQMNVQIGLDTDQDGITDKAEMDIFLTDPNLFDTDNDLLPDGVEIRAQGLNPLVVDDSNGDLDLDNLTNLNEVIYRSRIDVADSDRDGTGDGDEVTQGSDPNNADDLGYPPSEEELVELKLTVGDHSGSNSERYNLTVGPVVHQAPVFGVVRSADYQFRRGSSHQVSIAHRGTNLDVPDYDYTARIAANDNSAIFIRDPDRILGVHGESNPFYADGKVIDLYLPYLDLDILDANGQPFDDVDEDDKGGFVLLNADDDDGDGTPDNVDANVPGEDDLIKLRLNKMLPTDVNLPGDVVLEFNSSRFNLWLDAGKTMPIQSGQTTLDETLSHDIYVEGISSTDGQQFEIRAVFQRDFSDNEFTVVGSSLFDTVKLSVGTGNLTGYRPTQNDISLFGDGYFYFERRAVADSIEDDPSKGVGIRINNDDDNGNGTPDRLDAGSIFGVDDNDLIEISVEVSPGQSGLVFTRSMTDITLWTAANKRTQVLFPNNGLESELLEFDDSGTATFFAEWVTESHGVADLVLTDKASGAEVDKLVFHTFQTTVVALSGEMVEFTGDDLEDEDRRAYFQLVEPLYYDQGYDVSIWNEDDVEANGTGDTYDEILNAVRNRNVQHIAIIGYSHGGGSTYSLANRLNQNQIGTISFTAYIDAIQNDAFSDRDSEPRLPPGTQYHVNDWQPNTTGAPWVRGGETVGANRNTEHTDHVHGTIDQDLAIHRQIRSDFASRNIPT